MPKYAPCGSAAMNRATTTVSNVGASAEALDHIAQGLALYAAEERGDGHAARFGQCLAQAVAGRWRQEQEPGHQPVHEQPVFRDPVQEVRANGAQDAHRRTRIVGRAGDRTSHKKVIRAALEMFTHDMPPGRVVLKQL